MGWEEGERWRRSSGQRKYLPRGSVGVVVCGQGSRGKVSTEGKAGTCRERGKRKSLGGKGFSVATLVHKLGVKP